MFFWENSQQGEVVRRTADITYNWTAQGWLYLAVVLDLFPRRVVGWSISNRIKKELVWNSLQMVIFRGRTAPDVMFVMAFSLNIYKIREINARHGQSGGHLYMCQILQGDVRL